MSDPVANTQLELACRIGSLGDVLEALEEGADINCNGSQPLFIAIMAGNRAIVSALVERGADVSLYEIGAPDPGQIVDALMKLAPAPIEEDESGDSPGMVDVDGKMVRAFDRMLRGKGLAEPLKKGRGDEYPAFREALRWIAAEECHAVVVEFLEMVEHVRAEAGEEGIQPFLESSVARIAELSERYATASNDEVPGDLLKEYLKERKQVA